MSYRVKLTLFFLCAIAILFLVDTAYEGFDTLSRLNVIETDRDQWQCPSDAVQALDLKPGNIMVDLGCGSGYFTLKLSGPVGESGRVLAEDIRRLPLSFLWIRTFQRDQDNVNIVLGKPDDPHLPYQGVNAVLVANTDHEFRNSQAILIHVVQTLVSGGRLVVVDGEPRLLATGSSVAAAELHEVSSEKVEGELRHARCEIISRQDRFTQNDPLNEDWWTIATRKPQRNCAERSNGVRVRNS